MGGGSRGVAEEADARPLATPSAAFGRPSPLCDPPVRRPPGYITNAEHTFPLGGAMRGPQPPMRTAARDKQAPQHADPQPDDEEPLSPYDAHAFALRGPGGHPLLSRLRCALQRLPPACRLGMAQTGS